MLFRSAHSAVGGARTRRSVPLGLSAVGAALIALAAVPAYACVTDAECIDADTCTLIDTCQAGVCVPGGGGDVDGDLVCEAEDNCPGVANVGQSDLDEDGAGDACDGTDAVLNVVSGRFKRNFAPNPAKPNGVYAVRGDFTLDDAEGPLSSASGVIASIRVKATDPNNPMLDYFTESISFPPSECAPTSTGGILCKSADKVKRVRFAPVPKTNGRQWRYTFTRRAGGFNVTFDGAGPAIVTLTTGGGLTSGIDREGQIIDCRANGVGITCRE